MRKFYNKYKRFLIPLVVLLLLGGYQLYGQFANKEPPPTLGMLAEAVASADVQKAEVLLSSDVQTRLTLTTADGTATTYTAPAELAETYVADLMARGIPVTVSSPGLGWEQYLSWAVTIALLGSLLLTQKRLGGFAGMGDSLKPQKSDVKFEDVAGIDEVRGELEQLVAFLKNPKAMTALGGRAPRGTLLVGPPGTGKTLIAKAVSGEAGVPFFTMSGSEFDEMFVGVGSSRVRKLFKAARDNAPSIIFIDELDALGKKRTESDSRHAAQSLNQLLVEMDGFAKDSGVVVIAATNRVDDLDPALRRPGRFDRQIQVPLPDLKGREDILKVTVRVRKIPLAEDADLKVVARGTAGFSGADLANLINEAALLTTKEERTQLTMDDFDRAREKIVMGLMRPQIISDADKRVTSIHEAGHALVALRHAGVIDPVYKATILPRGGALGMVVMLPEQDHVMMSLGKLKAQLEVMFGGRMAEKALLKPGEVTTGAAQDLQQITQLANRMVTEWGFGAGDTLSPNLAYRERADVVNGTQGRLLDISPETRTHIDEQVKALVNEAADSVATFFDKHKGVLEELSKALLEKETLTGDELRQEFLPKLTKAT